MKSPENVPPADPAITASAVAGPQPTIDLAHQALTGMELESGSPKLSPPQMAATTEGTVGAAVWQTDKRVTGLYTTFHPRNSWMFIAGLGWKRVATASDSTQEAMNLLASHCRERNCRIDFSEENGLVKEIYVW